MKKILFLLLDDTAKIHGSSLECSEKLQKAFSLWNRLKRLRNFCCIIILTIMSTGADGSEELLPNGSFENQFKNWGWPSWEKKSNPGKIISSHVFGGKYAYEMGVPGDKDNYIFTSLPIDTKKSYILRFAMRCDRIPKGDLTIRMLAFRKDPAIPGRFKTNGYLSLTPKSGITKLFSLEGTHPWREYGVFIPSVSIPAGTCHVNLLIQRKNNGTGLVAIDEISWQEGVEKDLVVSDSPSSSQTEPEKKKTTDHAEAGNRWPGDGSFESYSWPFKLNRRKTDSFHGEYSLVLPPDRTEFHSGWLFGVMTRGQKSFLCFSARSDTPAQLTVRCYNEYYSTTGRKKLQVTNRWQRFTIPLNATPGNSIALSFVRNGTSDILLDGFTFGSTAVTSEAYCPVPLSCGISESEEPMEIYYTGKGSISRLVTFRNNQDSEKKLEAVLRLKTPLLPVGKVLSRWKRNLRSGERVETLVPVLRERIQGYYLLTLEVNCEGKTTRVDAPFIVTAPPVPITQDAMFGLHQGDYNAFRRIGMAQVRHFRNWSFWPRKHGQYDTWYDGAEYFNLRQPYRQYGMNHMETLFLARTPFDVKRGTPEKIPFEEMERFVDAIVTGTKGISNWFEIENEPHLAFPTEYKIERSQSVPVYAKIVNRLAPLIRKLNPNAKILGAGAGIRNQEQRDYICEVMKLAGKNIDVLAIHPYSASRYINAEHSDTSPDEINTYAHTISLRERCRALGFSPEIWYGEVGYALDVREDFLSSSALRHAAYVARLMLIAKAAGVRKVFYFLGDNHIEKDHFYYGLWRVARPLPAALAYAASAQLLEGGKADEVLSDNDIKRYTFRHRDGRLFAALWLSKGGQAKCIIDLPAEKVDLRNLFNQPLLTGKGKKIILDLSGDVVYLFCRDLPEKTFKEAITHAKVDLPPLSVSWRVRDRNEVGVTLKNIRSQTFNGNIQFRCGDFRQKKSCEIAAGSSREIRFTFPGNSGESKLHLEYSGDLGTGTSEYVFKLISCPFFTPRSLFFPSKGQLPPMTDRKYLLPNDPFNGWDGPENLSVKSALTYDEQNLYLAINVRDDLHVQSLTPGNLWRQDSVQVVIDTNADAQPDEKNLDRNDYEFGFALSNGQPAKELTFCYEHGRKKQILSDTKLNCFRKENITSYRIAIPWKSLKKKPARGSIFALNFTVNDNDGGSVRFYMGLRPGIVEGKNPYVYNKFILD